MDQAVKGEFLFAWALLTEEAAVWTCVLPISPQCSVLYLTLRYPLALIEQRRTGSGVYLCCDGVPAPLRLPPEWRFLWILHRQLPIKPLTNPPPPDFLFCCIEGLLCFRSLSPVQALLLRGEDTELCGTITVLSLLRTASYICSRPPPVNKTQAGYIWSHIWPAVPYMNWLLIFLLAPICDTLLFLEHTRPLAVCVIPCQNVLLQHFPGPHLPEVFTIP